MAKSFHTIIDEGSLEVLHNGNSITVDLPTWLAEIKGHLMDADYLISWAKRHNFILPTFHSAIQKLIIDLRAVCRPSDKSDGTPVVITSEYAIEKLAKFSWTHVNPPGISKAVTNANLQACQLAASAMLDSGLDDSLIHQYLDQKFGRLLVSQVLNDLAID